MPLILFCWTAAFFPYAAIHRIPLQNAHFLMRAQYSIRKYARIIDTLQPGDYLIEFHTSYKTRQETPGLPEVLTCRMIQYRIRGFRPSLLLTSLLDPMQFPADELIALYHRRWRIETIYREWKHGLEITNLRSHTPVGIAKEMHAHLILSNLVRYVMADAVEGIGKTPVEFSFLDALTALKNTLSLMSARPARIPDLYRHLLDTILDHPIRQRPGRRYPRKGETKIKVQNIGSTTCSATLLSLT